MKHFHIQTRRDFISSALKFGAFSALASLSNIPFVMKQALAADSTLGLNGKKLLFVFLRGANDQIDFLPGKLSEFAVGQRGALFQHPESPDDRPSPAKTRDANWKIHVRPLGLRTP